MTHAIKSAPSVDPLATARKALRAAGYGDEAQETRHLLEAIPFDDTQRKAVVERARSIVQRSRDLSSEQGTLDAFLQEFGLSNQEGVALMCLAEALLRIPDSETQDALISEKIRTGDWSSHLGKSHSPFVNAGVWALMLTGRIIKVDPAISKDPADFMDKLVKRTGEPVIRQAVNQAMRIMGRQFVFGRSIGEGLKRMSKMPDQKQLMSFDMLGEGARTQETADRYFKLYKDAIDAVGKHESAKLGGPNTRSSVSIKISALHPRYELTNGDQVMADVYDRLHDLALRAKNYDIQLTIDAEEADRLDLSLDLFEALARSPELLGWPGLGLALQAYQKRSRHVVDWLYALAHETHRRIPVRLVKGAYWDTEIKHAQELGMPDYPVWTRKAATDLSYLVCAKKLIDGGDAFYPMFATHNAHSIAAIEEMGRDADYEFQRLHGMGDVLYLAVRQEILRPVKARTYAPVGAHRDLLPYLVRRLLENGANSSFVNRFMDQKVPVEEVVRDPISIIEADEQGRHANIPLPRDLYGEDRTNSKGHNLQDQPQLSSLRTAIAEHHDRRFDLASLISGKAAGGAPQDVLSPMDRREKVGSIRMAGKDDAMKALKAAQTAFPAWNRTKATARADILRKAADLLEDNTALLISLMVREAGKTLSDGIAEVREAVDFCSYYAMMAEKQFGAPTPLPGPTGERNELMLEGRGVFLSISPWNFPLAIFTGQVMAALAAGNTVLAKPAEQTSLIAAFATELFHRAGVPADALHLLAGDGPEVAGPLVEDEGIAGVVFTGSTEVARLINRNLAAREGAIVPLIAETGGQNAMIVDSTALPEQVCDAVMESAFGSAGQRCSALRILCVQSDVADEVIQMIKGALALRKLGDPVKPETDIGPIIDEEARAVLQKHVERMDKDARFIARAPLDESLQHGCFFAPAIYEISSLAQLDREVFGPVLHILRYKADQLDQLMHNLAATGYGLTCGIHSRLEGRYLGLFEKSIAGNVYINRNMVGAVVGVQPFGGRGLSGTGFKAGGPHYLLRFASERVRTINTAAIGGNTDLFRLIG
ncbi:MULTISPECIES: bifunctional proline dehydrogenase/L-glutamate gamma-semialdehyde dehydrogenase PutA [unclassified Iodidimonas]|uniref:bifunctional proline dehydrogenase/L-glutamate gamma-semialdehyde dehydrogenase PutA n=1 Tax=unclassified Iodidimonas TaxID=2626145 RepID=UPI002482BC26|nr:MULTISPECIES: bifunctional proline dehydrogenase/L-glutamate gamma-semialdehyde dehydrogenase PutA [unclassified Iodidimonas]